jgi:tripartite-type tricarboxylate transporter receptor subunit TctC
MMGNLGTQAASVGLYPKLAYDPRTDFEPVMNSASTPMLVVAQEGPARQGFPAEFVALISRPMPRS